MAERVLLPPDVTMATAHGGFRFSLAAAPALIHSARGDDVRRHLVAEYYANVLLVLEVHHHGEEELYFPLLVERFPDERDKVDLGAEQHHDVVSFAAAATDAVTRWGAEGDAVCEDVLSTLGALDEALCVHLDYEEKTIVPLENGLADEERRRCLDRTAEHHAARIPNLPGTLLSLAHGRAYLWQAVGERSFRDMVARAPRTG